MTRSRTQWTTAIAAAALFTLPLGAKAQTPATPQSPAAAAQTSQQAATPQDHLQQAESALNSISPTAVTGEAKTKIAELKQHLNALERAAGAGDAASARGNTKWASEAAAMDRILTELLGPGTTTGAVGTSGTTSSKATDAVAIDEDTRKKLDDVRTHVTAFTASFGASMSGAAPAATPSAAAAARGTEPPAAATQPPPSAAAQPPASAAAQTPPQTAEAQPPAGQPSQSEARRHLTMARESLSQLTQLPAASQLAGDTRAQVSQLITNFNELITTNADWKAAYAKVDASVMTLLGTSAGDEPPTAAVPPTTAAPTGTPGAVGTAGSTALDPTIRAKLVEFRAHLKDFEKAAGASAPAAAATSAANPATAAPAAATPPSAANPSAPEAAAAPSPTADDAMQHVTAIENILNGSAASGDAITLDRAQLEQLRNHLALLKKAVEKK